MTRISSQSMLWYKRIFPAIWFGGVLLFALPSLLSEDVEFSVAIFPLIMIAGGIFVMRQILWDLVDEVYDEGSSLLFRNGKITVRVNLRDIMNVNYPPFMSPPRVTLKLRYNTQLGSEISFLPNSSLVSSRRFDGLDELIERIDYAKRGGDPDVW